MHRLLLIFSLLILTITSPAEIYKKVQIYFTDRTELREILRSDLDIDHAEVQSDNSIIVFLSSTEYRRLLDHGYRHKVLIEDWQNYYLNRQKMTALEKQAQLQQSAASYGVTSFKFGSMGGFYTFDEIVAELDSMRIHYPNIISEKISIGQSIEGRDLWMVKISDNPDQDEEEPQVCFDALMHAREGASMATVMYFMNYLLENYGRDSVVTYLINNREMYFLPCLNPDGYEYNRQISPNGGGMWRKNRRDNGDGSYGVDLNRNFPVAWNWDDSGSSSDGFDETYRGTTALSEPEAFYFAEFIKSKSIRTHFNYHTYSNIILYPWSYIPDPTPDADMFLEYARDMSKSNGYNFGGGDAIGYFANGTLSDWMYGEQAEKDKIFSFVVEVGTSDDGFWAAQDRIIPLAEANIGSNLYLSWLPGGFAAVAALNLRQSLFLPGDSIACDFIIKNRGLEQVSNVRLAIESQSDHITVNPDSYDIDPLDIWASDTVTAEFLLSSGTPAGEQIKLAVRTFYNNLPMDIDTLSFFVGIPTAFFADSGNSIGNYQQYTNNLRNTWEQTDQRFHSAPGSYTDSKDGNYYSNVTTYMSMTEPVDLAGYSVPRLSFWTQYEIETNWDCGMVQISTDSGLTWTALEGIYTNPGSGTGTQGKDIPVYHGFQTSWVQEDIDLSAYTGESILLRFILKSDDYVEYDGWYIDDIRIYYYGAENSTGVATKPLTAFEFGLAQNYPNPFNPTTRIDYQIEKAGLVNLKIYNLRGEKIAEPVNKYQNAGKYSCYFDINTIRPSLSSGAYFYILRSGNQFQARKMLLLK